MLQAARSRLTRGADQRWFAGQTHALEARAAEAPLFTGGTSTCREVRHSCEVRFGFVTLPGKHSWKLFHMLYDDEGGRALTRLSRRQALGSHNVFHVRSTRVEQLCSVPAVRLACATLDRSALTFSQESLLVKNRYGVGSEQARLEELPQ